MTICFINPEDPRIDLFEPNGTDTEESFNRNKKMLGKDWYYYDKKIEYVYNEQGFRNKPFNEVVWEDSIVVFGCSNIKGTGHPIEDTICYKLEETLGIPVVNMGISGGGVDITCWNSLILHEHYSRPKAIVHMWTSLDRYTEFDGRDINLLHHSKKGQYCLNHNWDKRSRFYIAADRALWRNKLPYYECSMFIHVAKELKIDFYDQIDNARDQNHPGVKSYEVVVQGIVENLIKQGIKK
jgi:hypothetical protein